MLHIFEGKEAVIKMIIKRLRPMRHVSRTHWVAFDWMLDRINPDRKIQIKYVDTKNQLADILTKAVSHVMSGTIFSICSISAIWALPMQEGTGEEIIEAKWRPTMNLVSKTVASSPTAQSSSASNCLGTPQSTWSKLESYRSCAETCRQRFESKWRSIEFSSAAVRCKTESQRGEICCNRNKPNGWYTHPWPRTTWLSDRAVQLSTAKVYVFFDSAMHLPGDTLHLARATFWTTKCPTDWLSRRDSVLKIGTLDLGVEKKELSKNRLRWNGRISLWKKQLNTWITSSSRHASTWDTMEVVPLCSIKILSSQTARSRPFTFMTWGIPSRTRWFKEKLDGWYRVSFQKHPFVGSHAVANRPSPWCPCTSTRRIPGSVV